ncbi:MAG: glycosyltransferase family 9 protein [Candidatus Eisenbacteria bacterium]
MRREEKSERRFRLALASVLFRLVRTRPLAENPFDLVRNRDGVKGPSGARTLGREAQEPKPRGRPAILVVRQQNQMGDMLLASPCLRALRGHFPDAYIALLASHENQAVVRDNPHLDEVFVYDKPRFRRSPVELLRLLAALRARRFDVAIVLSTVSLSVTSVLLALLSGARYRVSYGGKDYGMSFADAAFHVPVPLGDPGVHQTRLGLGLLEHFGITAEDLSPMMATTAEADEFARAFLAGHNVDPSHTVVGIHPGAGKRKNRWPASSFGQVAEALAEGARVIAIAGPSDKDVLAEMLREVALPMPLLSGESIGRVAAVLKRLSLFICNDTGVLHVAAAVGCPTLALFGPTDPEKWAPLTPACRTIRAPSADLAGLGVGPVLAAAREILAAGTAGAKPKKEHD